MLMDFVFFSFSRSFCSLWKDDVKTTNRCDRPSTPLKYTEINLNWQSFIYASKSQMKNKEKNNILYKWSWKYYIHFFFICLIIIQWFCARVEWSDIKNFKSQKACREFLILNGATRTHWSTVKYHNGQSATDDGNKREKMKQQPASKLDRFNSFLFSWDVFTEEKKTSLEIR